MNTSILTSVLAGFLLAGQGATPSWQNDYAQAQREGVAQKKPLAVLFGSGPNGWSKVVSDPSFSKDAAQLLADKYVPVYVDMATPAGKKLAQEFGMTGKTGMTISDRSGELQAFSHQGEMTNDSIVSSLQRYSNPNFVVRTTENANTSRTSFYPSENASTVDGAQPYSPGVSLPGSSYCPSCNNVRGRR